MFKSNPVKKKASFFISPLFVLCLISLFIIYRTYKDYKVKQRSKIFDAILFSITGLIGVVILLLWFATDHSMTVNNWNVLWLVPFNILFIRKFALKRKECKSLWKHSATLLAFIVIMLFLWLIQFQVFALAAIPLLVMLLSTSLQFLEVNLYDSLGTVDSSSS